MDSCLNQGPYLLPKHSTAPFKKKDPKRDPDLEN